MLRSTANAGSTPGVSIASVATCPPPLHCLGHADLDLIFRTHERLEKFKPEDQRGEPFVFFTNCEWGGHIDVSCFIEQQQRFV
jgi:hypothetical protein